MGQRVENLIVTALKDFGRPASGTEIVLAVKPQLPFWFWPKDAGIFAALWQMEERGTLDSVWGDSPLNTRARARMYFFALPN